MKTLVHNFLLFIIAMAFIGSEGHFQDYGYDQWLERTPLDGVSLA